MSKRNDFLRLIALLIDSVFVSFIASFIFNFFADASISSTFFSFEIFMFLGYLLIFDFRNEGQTLGMIIVNIKPGKNELRSRINHSFIKIVSVIIFPITILVYVIKGKIIHDLVEYKQDSMHVKWNWFNICLKAASCDVALLFNCNEYASSLLDVTFYEIMFLSYDDQLLTSSLSLQDLEEFNKASYIR